MPDSYGPFTSTGGGNSVSFAIYDLAIVPTPTVSFNLGANRSNSWNNQTTRDLTIGSGSVGDLLVAAIVAPSGITCTPPTGWTALAAITGIGTNSIVLLLFWKIAVTGDLSGVHNFVLSSNTHADGIIFSFATGSFDATAGVTATTTSVSAADVTSAPVPAVPGAAGNYVIEVIGFAFADGLNPSTFTAPLSRSSEGASSPGQAGFGMSVNEFFYINPLPQGVWGEVRN